MTLVWRPGFMFDEDASTYIEAVEAADGQVLEAGVRYAINNFVIGCKADGIWNAIKASCILAGARTLSGALVPLAGTAPTNFNFVSGDYNRKTGLVRNGGTKYLDSNRSANADPINNAHLAVYVDSVSSDGVYIGNIDNGNHSYIDDTSSLRFASRNGHSFASAPRSIVGFLAWSRSSPSGFNYIFRRNVYTSNIASAGQSADSTYIVFGRRNLGNPDYPILARLAFYSIGESLNLALLDARVTDLMNAIGAAIP